MPSSRRRRCGHQSSRHHDPVAGSRLATSPAQVGAAEVSTESYSRADWPPRARIRGLAPIGVGTGWVEAASGLLGRTAAENHLPVRRLMDRVLAEAAGAASQPGESPEAIAALGRDLVRLPAASVNGG